MITTTPPAQAVLDCSRSACLDVSGLPASRNVDWADMIRRAHRLFGVRTGVFIVPSARTRARLPYMLPQQVPLIMEEQIHIPEIYHFVTEHKFRGKDHFVWHFIIGHEMAHAYQERLNLIEAMKGPFNSVVMAELHADFLAGFYLTREYGLTVAAIEQLSEEVSELPTGQPGDVVYHGSPTQRFFMVTQGALLALRTPRPTLAEASAEGLRQAFDMALKVTRGAR